MNQMILSYGEFVTYIQENMEDRLADRVNTGVTVTAVMKNNGVMSDTLTIEHADGCVVPAFYLKDLYGSYLNGTDIDMIIERMMSHYNSYMHEQGEWNADWLSCFENIREQIFLKVVNYERNNVQLEGCPYIQRLDLAITFRVLIRYRPYQLSSMLVTNTMMSRWQVSVNELFGMALENTQRLWPSLIEPMENVIHRLAAEFDRDCCVRTSVSGAAWDSPMYVLSNTIHLNGATALFYSDVLCSLAKEKACDILILPSSIHEVLLLPESETGKSCGFRQIVEQVNRQIVEDEEVLSDHVYRYIYQENRLIIDA